MLTYWPFGELDLLYASGSDNHVLVLDALNTTTPVYAGLFLVVELFMELAERVSIKVVTWLKLNLM